MNIADFLMENVDNGETEREVKLERFKSPFVIVAISEEENAGLRKSSTAKRISKSGNKVADLDTDKYVDRLVVRCVKFPDLHNAQLQADYGTDGDPAATLKKMLRPGEYAELSKQIQDLNGFEDDVEELSDDVKK